MSYIEQLLNRKFTAGQEVKVDAKELQRLADFAMRKCIEVDMLRAKIAGYEVVEKIEKIKIYA